METLTITLSDYVLAAGLVGVIIGMVCTLAGLIVQQKQVDKKILVFAQKKVNIVFRLMKGCAKHPWDVFNVIFEAFRFAATSIMAAASAASLWIIGSLRCDYLQQGMETEAMLCGFSLLTGFVLFYVQCSWVLVALQFTSGQLKQLLDEINLVEFQESEDTWNSTESSEELH